MNWLWIYWPAALAIIVFVLFGPFEWWAIKHGGPTFSRFMRSVSDAGFWGKLWIFAWGMLIGGLFVHFNGWCVGG